MAFYRNVVLGALLLGPSMAIAAAAGAQANADRLTVKTASIGFGGKFKAGFWQPVRLTVVAGPEGARGQLELVVLDGDQAPVVYRDDLRGQIDLQSNQEHSLLLYAKSGPIAAGITVRLVDQGIVVWSHDISLRGAALRSTQELIVGIGPSAGLEEAAATIRRRGDAAVRAAEARTVEELPDRWWGYDGIDVLVLTTSDLGYLAALTEERRQAIIEWVLLGGRIVLCVGGQGEVIAKADSLWAAFIPGELAEVAPLRERSGLERFTKSELPFDDPTFQRQRPYVTRLKNVRGEVLLDEANASAGRPLVIHAPAGLGQAVFVGLDLDHPSLKQWKGKPRLIALLVQIGAPEHEPGDREIHRSVTHLGYDDLVGQLRAALDQFPGVTLVNFTTVSVLTLVYLLLIGPCDFLLLSRLGLPRHLTWFTFPVVAAGVIVLTGVLGRQAHGGRARLNQAEIVDVDLAHQLARGTVWSHLYSPKTQFYTASLKIAAPSGVAADQPSGWLAWQGLPGDSLGGLESVQPALVRREPYRCAVPGQAPQLTALTIQAASSKSLAAAWWSRTQLPTDTQLTIDRFGLLAGEFKQPLPVALTECLLAHGEKLYRLGKLEPGERVRIADLPPLNLEARLTERRVENSKDISTPWERDSVDIPRIVQMLMFHESARGSSYTGLTHRYQPETDLSEHIRLGQAVLVGRAGAPVARLMGDGATGPLIEDNEASTWTWYRIVLPVQHPQPH
jgi:hypothetical protein